jgi:hypothetical protein
MNDCGAKSKLSGLLIISQKPGTTGIDMETGRIAYAVLSFGGFLGMGDKLFAVPFQSMQFDVEDEEFVLDVNIERLKNAPGFDRNHWPKMGEREWGSKIHADYGQKPYWVDE